MNHPVKQAPDALRISQLNEMLGRFLIPQNDRAATLSAPLGMLPLITQYIEIHGAGPVFELAIRQKELNVLCSLLSANEDIVDLGSSHSHSLTQYDTILGKPAGYSCRLLLSSMGDVESCASQIPLKCISQAIAAHLGEGKANLIVKNGFMQFTQKLAAAPSDSFPMQLYTSLHARLAPLGIKSSLSDLNRALFENLLEEDFCDTRPTYEVLFELARSTPSLEQSLTKALGGMLGDENLSSEATHHLVDFLLTPDEQFVWFQEMVIKSHKPDRNHSDRVMEAVRVGLKFLAPGDLDFANKLNSLENGLLSKSIKSRDDFLAISGIGGFDMDKIDKSLLSYEARGSYFTQELDV